MEATGRAKSHEGLDQKTWGALQRFVRDVRALANEAQKTHRFTALGGYPVRVQRYRGNGPRDDQGGPTAVPSREGVQPCSTGLTRCVLARHPACGAALACGVDCNLAVSCGVHPLRTPASLTTFPTEGRLSR